MDAIVTRVVPPTATKGTRMKAICGSTSMTAGYDHKLSEEWNHDAIRKLMAVRRGWCKLSWYSGTLPNGDRVHVASK